MPHSDAAAAALRPLMVFACRAVGLVGRLAIIRSRAAVKKDRNFRGRPGSLNFGGVRVQKLRPQILGLDHARKFPLGLKYPCFMVPLTVAALFPRRSNLPFSLPLVQQVVSTRENLEIKFAAAFLPSSLLRRRRLKWLFYGPRGSLCFM